MMYMLLYVTILLFLLSYLYLFLEDIGAHSLSFLTPVEETEEDSFKRFNVLERVKLFF